MSVGMIISFIILVVLTAILVFTLGGLSLYNKYGWFKFWFHDILQWHSPDNRLEIEGINIKSYCKYCHREICLDSQGNWFALDDYRPANNNQGDNIND